MTKREQILVIAMTAAVVWGASGVVMGMFKSRGGKADLATAQANLQEFADSQRALMQQMRLGGREKLVLDEAIGPWAASPFLIEASRTRPAEERVMNFSYTGYMQVGDQHFAILNGREYRVADTVRATDFVVESIQPDHVVLASGSGGRRVTVDLVTSNPERKLP